MSRRETLPAIDMGPADSTGKLWRAQHDEIGLDPIVAGFKGDQVVGHRGKVKAPFALDRYRSRQELDPQNRDENERRFLAGDRLRARWTIAGLEPKVVGGYAEMIASSGYGNAANLAGTRRDAYQDWIDAVRAVGPIASDEVLSVCCLGAYIGRERIEFLRRGLRVLADYYRMR